MRNIYLIRHGAPEFPNGEFRCLGQNSDPPLSAEGEGQARGLAPCFDGLSPTVFSSPLLRSRQTAGLLSGGRWPVHTAGGLEELCCGEWEGLTFNEIRARYPEIYELRRSDMSIPPPGGETFASAAARALACLRSALRETQGDLIVVAHAGVNRAVMCSLLGIPMKDNRTLDQKYACINVLTEDGGRLAVSAVGRLADSVPDADEMDELLLACHTPDAVREHCIAVARTALSMADSLALSGVELDRHAIAASALLHDMCRAEKSHAARAAEILRGHGYLRVASIVAAHHDCASGGDFSEKKLLFLADKLVSGTRPVTISERFSASLPRCTTEAALCAHARREAEANALLNEFNTLSGRGRIYSEVKDAKAV